MMHPALHMAGWKCGVLITWQAGLEAGRGRGRETTDCRGILGDSKWRLVVTFSFCMSPLTGNFLDCKETFTLGTAIGLNMNASFYADNVNAAARNKARLVVFLLVMYSCRFMKSTRLESFQRFLPKRLWNLWKASTVHEQSKYWQYWSFFFDWDRKGAIYCGDKGQL